MNTFGHCLQGKAAYPKVCERIQKPYQLLIFECFPESNELGSLVLKELASSNKHPAGPIEAEHSRFAAQCHSAYDQDDGAVTELLVEARPSRRQMRR